MYLSMFMFQFVTDDDCTITVETFKDISVNTKLVIISFVHQIKNTVSKIK